MTELELEFRTATQIGVSYPRRLIELVVMPYERVAQVEYRGRQIREIVSRDAFQGIDAKARRVVVNRGHMLDKVVGKAVAFHPSREEGLVAELKIADTLDGTDTLELAKDGLLDASAGFGVMDGGETWPERSLRRLTKLWLHHIAMTPDPAYPDARVLAVRAVVPDPAGPVVATPNRDLVKSWRLADRYAMISPTTE
jgi:HK97 family phage prohead protease